MVRPTIYSISLPHNMTMSVQQASLARKKYEDSLPVINFAIKEEKIEVLNMLLQQVNDLEINLCNDNDVALFYVACLSGNVSLLKKFKDQSFPIDSPLKRIPRTLPALQSYFGFTGLHFAFKYHRLDTVHFLLSQRANIFIQNQQKNTPLHLLFETKKQALVKQSSLESYNQIIDVIFLANDQKIDNLKCKINRIPYFHIACTKDEPGFIQNFLRKNEAGINQCVGGFLGHERFSPLHFALTYKCDKVAKLLLNRGANVNQVDSKNRAALHLTDSPDIAELILQHGADFTLQDSVGNTPLHRAFERRNFAIMDLILSAHINNNTNPSNSIGISHLHIACARNNEIMVKHFLNNGAPVNSCVPIDPKIEYTYYWDDLDWRGCSPLHFAVAFNMSEVVKLLLSLNADVKTQDARGFTALHLACRSMHEKIEELILGSLPDYSSDEIKWINWASNRRNYIDIIKMLLEYQSDINCHDHFNNTPVFCAYVYYAIDDSTFLKKYQKPARDDFLREMRERRNLILELLLQHPVDLDECHDNYSILHYMVKEAQVSNSYSGQDELSLLKMFLEKGLTVDDLNRKMLTPLYVAVQKTDRMDFILLLIKHGASVNYHEPERHSTILHLNFCRFCELIFKAALSKGADPNARQLDGSTVLHQLACSGYFPEKLNIFESLIEAGADVNACDAKGQPPLFKACLHGNEQFVEKILHHGANVNIEDNTGKTVLCFMYEEKFVENQLNKKTNEADKKKGYISIPTLMVLLNHVTKKRTSISEKVLSAREKIMDCMRLIKLN